MYGPAPGLQDWGPVLVFEELMEDFATLSCQFTEEGRECIEIFGCDGSSPETTLEAQLLKHGIIEKRWSIKEMKDGCEIPGTIFYWFKHVASQSMTPDTIKMDPDQKWHCGICYHEINNIYYYRKTSSAPINLNRHLDIILPETIVSGSECIHLADEMRNLIRYLFDHGIVSHRMTFTHGRIDAQCVVDSFETWDREEVALPVSWFYFKPNFRRGLVSNNPSAYKHPHVYEPFDYNSVPLKMNGALRQAKFTLDDSIFIGMESDGRRVDVNTDGQTVNACLYLVIDRKTAQVMANPVEYLARRKSDDLR